jgi:hypothetical protein
MKNKASLFWGIALILLSAGLLAEQLGYIHLNEISNNTWFFVFGGAAILFLLGYFVNGLKHWGLLFPALIFAALSLTIGLATRNVEGSFLGAPILAAVALPFYVGFAVNRRNWGLLIPAWVLTVLTIITFMADQVEGTLIGALVQFSIALPFLLAFLANRTRRWALIPFWVLFILGLITLLSEQVNGNLIGALFMYAVALPFLVVYLLNRKHRWALIPAAIIAVVGTFPLLDLLIGGDVMGAAVMFLFALPFFFVYFRWKDQWWALIPAGIFTSIGLVVVISMLIPDNQAFWNGILTGVLLLGFGLTFGLLWLRRNTQPTAWTRFPAIGLLVASLLAFVLGRNFQNYWAVVLLVVGIMLIVTSLLPKKPGDPTPPMNPS